MTVTHVVPDGLLVDLGLTFVDCRLSETDGRGVEQAPARARSVTIRIDTEDCAVAMLDAEFEDGTTVRYVADEFRAAGLFFRLLDQPAHLNDDQPEHLNPREEGPA